MVLGSRKTSARAGCLADYEKPHQVLLLRDPGEDQPYLGWAEKKNHHSEWAKGPTHKGTAGSVTKD